MLNRDFFSKDLESGLMDISLELANVAFFIVLLTWILLHILRSWRDDAYIHMVHRVVGEFSLFTKITLLSNLIILIFHLSFAVCEYWNHKIVCFKSVISIMTWVSATVVSVYSKNRVLVGQRRWPLVLVLWWVFSWILDLLSVSVYLITHLRSAKLPHLLPEANIVDMVSLPFLTLLCFNALHISCTRNHIDLEHPLIQKEDENSSRDTNAFTNAGILSRIMFRWLNPLFKRGRIQKLELPHIPSVPHFETAENASSLLEESLRKPKMEASSFPIALILAVWKPLAINAVFAGINTIALYMGPFLIKYFVSGLNEKHDEASYWNGVILAVIFFILKTVESLTQGQWHFGAQRIAIRVKAALTVLMYKKSVSAKGSAAAESGKITNMINVDIDRIGDFYYDVHQIWLLPVQVILALVILYQNLGVVPSIVAMFTTVFVMVGNIPLAKFQKSLQSTIMDAKDSRVKATTEIVKNMRILKMQSWEPAFLEKLLLLRETERFWIKRFLYASAAVQFLFWTSPTLVSAITFGTCLLFKTPLTSGVILSAVATFTVVREPIYKLPELISLIAQTKVSIARIQGFIGEEDQGNLISSHTSKSSDIAVKLEMGEYAWDTSDQNLKRPTIKLTERMKIMKGQKVAVCGSVGSGKSSLLCSILGEIPRISGAGIKVYGTKAYVPQSAWIQTGTVRENVLFGKEMNALYEEVLEGCALSQDIEMWVDGDLSVVGERGMNLSGGQKQRIQLARAVYSDSDVYILDDPFSAVDAHTGTHLFKKCLLELLSKKTVVYATHQLEFLNAADLVLVIKDGIIVQSGKYEDLTADLDGELVRQLNAHRKSVDQINPPQEDSSWSSRTCQISQTEVTEEKFQEPMTRDEFTQRNIEETETGRVSWSVYSTFITAAYKGALVPVILLCQVLFQGLQMGSNYWIAWATEEEDKVSKGQLMGIFILLSGGSSIFILGRAVFLATITIETAQSLFLGMVKSVFRAHISFFDSTPSSQILSRSSSDQSTLDTYIPYRLAGLVFALIQVISVVILMSYVAWQVFPLFLAILGISIWYQTYYISTARELARMVQNQKAPIIHHFSESIMGAETIRCFNQEDRFLMKNFQVIDDLSRASFYNFGTMEWLSVRINLLFNLIFFIVLMILVSLPASAIDPSLAGLAATYGLNLNTLQAWVIWNLCNVENKMISVERVLQFQKIPSEAPLLIQNSRPEPDWPRHGKIDFENLHVRYSPEKPMVLKGITCTIPGETKIAIVGRTGSGKSTLVQSLFRVMEPSEGRIIIDGLDVSLIGLQDLRSRLGIIPQDPVLFQGTMRINLDPFQEHSDQEIWEVLKKCHLADTIMQDHRRLDAPVVEDGENWSVGQRQLVCLARVLLKKRRILVLDEATASIDTATDNLIQETIREETSRCTVITVAHRIPTVIDNDLVMVLDEGKVIEYDSPRRLVEDKSSSFSKLVAEFLRRSSKSNHQRNMP